MHDTLRAIAVDDPQPPRDCLGHLELLLLALDQFKREGLGVCLVPALRAAQSNLWRNVEPDDDGARDAQERATLPTFNR